MNTHEKLMAHAAGATEVDGVKFDVPIVEPKPSYKIAITVALTCDNPIASYPEQVEAAMALAFSTLNQLPPEPGRTDTMQFEDGTTTLEVTTSEVQTVFRQVPAYQQRVLDEQHDLAKKLTALREFVNDSTKFAPLPPEMRTDLKEQCTAMWNYNVILLRRIRGFRIAVPTEAKDE